MNIIPAGSIFSRMEVIGWHGVNSHQQSLYLCKCVCGKQKVVMGSQLKNGKTRSCGCLAAELFKKRVTKHGLSSGSIYSIWAQMRRRCRSAKATFYSHYGGRGIKVCERWNKSFENFLADMGPRPSPKHTLDRRDNDGNYEPSNCRWATKKEQALNKSNTVLIKHDGQTLCLLDWSVKCGVSEGTLRMRIARGWTPARAITTKTNNNHGNG